MFTHFEIIFLSLLYFNTALVSTYLFQNCGLSFQDYQMTY